MVQTFTHSTSGCNFSAFGKVFEAWLREDEDDLHKVAVKHVQTQSQEHFDRHMQEARLMLQFRHPVCWSYPVVVVSSKDTCLDLFTRKKM